MVEDVAARLLAGLDAVEPLLVVADRAREGRRGELERLVGVLLGHDGVGAVVAVEGGVLAVEVDAQATRSAATTVEVPAVAVRAAHHPGHRQVGVLEQGFLHVGHVADVVDDEAAAVAAHLGRVAELERPDGQVHDVRRHPRDPAAAVVHEPAVAGAGASDHRRVVGPHRPGADPHLPVEPLGHRLVGGPAQAATGRVHHEERAHAVDLAEDA